MSPTAQKVLLCIGHWLYGLARSGIVGGVTMMLSVIGISSLDEFGVDIAKLDMRQCLAITVSGAIVSMALFLKNHPLPDAKDENEIPSTTDRIVKPPVG